MLLRILVWLVLFYGLGCLLIAYVSVHPVRRGPWRTPAELGLTYHDRTLITADGLHLAAWWVPTPLARGVVILCHGLGASREQMLPFLPGLQEAGFSSLLFDFRASGQSEGKVATIGHKERYDLQAAIEHLRAQPETAELPLGVLGWSMGGAVAILEAAHNPDLSAVVADSAFADLRGESQHWLRGCLGPLADLFAPPSMWFAEHLFRLDLDAVRPIEHIGALAPRPVLLIHGLDDRLTSPTDAQDLFDAAGEPKELWQVPGASHCGSLEAQPGEYPRRVLAFFRRMGKKDLLP